MNIMKPLIYIFAILSLAILSSCDNENIDIKDSRKVSVDVTVYLTDFFSCYDFIDTKHHLDLEKHRRYKSLNAAEICKSFCSFYDPYDSNKNQYTEIQTIVLFYNDEGKYVDMIVDYSNNTDSVPLSPKLAPGEYTVIAILIFKVDGDFHWSLKEKENLNTVYLFNSDNTAIWSIMSYAYKEIIVGEKKDNRVRLTPTPVGALCYAYFQNFQNNDRIDNIRVYTDKFVKGFRLNPNTPDKYIYSDEKKLRETTPLTCSFFDYSATYFQGDFFDYFYILSPQCNIYYMYYDNYKKTWKRVDLPTCDIESGKTYLAYWDYNHVDQPYFGIADNDHWY